MIPFILLIILNMLLFNLLERLHLWLIIQSIKLMVMEIRLCL